MRFFGDFQTMHSVSNNEFLSNDSNDVENENSQLGFGFLCLNWLFLMAKNIWIFRSCKFVKIVQLWGILGQKLSFDIVCNAFEVVCSGGRAQHHRFVVGCASWWCGHWASHSPVFLCHSQQQQQKFLLSNYFSWLQICDKIEHFLLQISLGKITGVCMCFLI